MKRRLKMGASEIKCMRTIGEEGIVSRATSKVKVKTDSLRGIEQSKT